MRKILAIATSDVRQYSLNSVGIDLLHNGYNIVLLPKGCMNRTVGNYTYKCTFMLMLSKYVLLILSTAKKRSEHPKYMFQY